MAGLVEEGETQVATIRRTGEGFTEEEEDGEEEGEEDMEEEGEELFVPHLYCCVHYTL